ncbi:hypothetical protein SD71_16030 [Cohnella kolymensis]|uniref:Beta sliding clamp n=1 Tax=Cohnella kolymensis TaxID=1590652 RepID=A0ABR5A265_9BACL|nr:DNA polymerase III subunit beta [Cohnella kolymensis]KIL35139.1 hypothetical protein SD71_16030 [Cohnella kolymensis]
MKIVIQQSTLKRHLESASKFLPSKDGIPILSHIVLAAVPEGLRITAGNTETFIQSLIPSDDLTVEQSGATAIPGQKLTEIVNKLSDFITIQTEVGKVVIKAGKSEFALSTLDPEEYPTFPMVNGTRVSMKGKDLKELISTTAYAISTKEETPMFTGISFTQKDGVLTLTATDRHRLGRIQSEISGEDFHSVVAGKTLLELSKILGDGDIEISFDDAMLVKSADFTFYSRILVGSYPDTDKIIPTTFATQLEVNRHELAAALDRINIVAKESKQNLMKVTVNENELMMVSEQETKRVQEFVDIKGFTGESFSFGINQKYLSDAVKAIDANQMTMSLNGKTSPIIVRGKDELALHLVLPYRTGE